MYVCICLCIYLQAIGLVPPGARSARHCKSGAEGGAKIGGNECGGKRAEAKSAGEDETTRGGQGAVSHMGRGRAPPPAREEGESESEEEAPQSKGSPETQSRRWSGSSFPGLSPPPSKESLLPPSKDFLPPPLPGPSPAARGAARGRNLNLSPSLMHQHYVALPHQGRNHSELEGGGNHSGCSHSQLPLALAPLTAGGTSADLGSIDETLERLALKKAPRLPVRVHLRDRERATGDSEDVCSGHGTHQHEQVAATRHARGQQERPASPRIQQSMERERELQIQRSREREAEWLSLQAEREKEKGRMKDAEAERARAKEKREQERQRAQEWKLWEEQRKREQRIELQEARERELEQHRREVEAWKREREQQAQRQASPHAPASVARGAATQRLGVDDQAKASLHNDDAVGTGRGKRGGGNLGHLIMDRPVWMEATSCTSSVSSCAASSQEAGLNVNDRGQSATQGATGHSLAPDMSLHAPSPHKEDKGRQKGRKASIARLSLSLKALKGALKIGNLESKLGQPRSDSSRPDSSRPDSSRPDSSRPPEPSESAVARDGTPGTAGAPVGAADADASAPKVQDVSHMLPATPSLLSLVHPSFPSPDEDALQQVCACTPNPFRLVCSGR